MAKWRAENNDRKDPWGFLPTDSTHKQRCFECGIETTGRHHVVPAALGGTKQIPLCREHHKLVHGFEMAHAKTISEGMTKAKARGVKLGRPVKANMEVIAKAKKLRIKGEPYKIVAKKLGLSVGTIHRILASSEGT